MGSTQRPVLFVSKDMGSCKVTLPVALVLHKMGIPVKAIVEGLAGAQYVKELGQIADDPIYFKCAPNCVVDPTTPDVSGAIGDLNPAVIVCGESAPINLEGRFARGANYNNVPLVVIDDLWGGFRRVDAKPTLIVTLDEYGEKLARKAHPKRQVVVGGNPGVPSEGDIQTLKGVAGQDTWALHRAFDKVILFVGGGANSTVEEIKLLKKCLEITPGNWCLITRFHPKWEKIKMPDADYTYGQYWREFLHYLGGRWIDGAQGPFQKTDYYVPLADVVVAGMSTLITTAAALGKPAVSLVVPEVLKTIKVEANLPDIPQAVLGWSTRTTEAIDLLSVPPLSDIAKASLMPYNPHVAAVAIQALF